MSEHVRSVFRARMVSANVLPYFETVGVVVDLNTTPDYWSTLEFAFATAARVSLGFPACFRETGTVLVHVIARSGVGDAQAFAYAEDLRSAFDGPYIDDVRIVVTHPPALSPTDNGNWIDVTVPVDYEFDYVVRAEAVPLAA